MKFFKRHWILSIFILLVSFVLVRAYVTRETDPYFLPTGYNGPWPGYKNWADYQEKMTASIKAGRSKVGLSVADDSLAFCSPIERRPPSAEAGSKGPYKRGILMFHGLQMVPGAFLDIMPVFEKAGFLIRCPTMPGHGTCPGDILEVGAEDWFAMAQFCVDEMRKEVDELYIYGMSTGGTLALLMALSQDPIIKGVLLESPAIQIANSLVWLTPYLDKLRWLDPFLRFPQKLSQRSDLIYTALSTRAGANVYNLTKQLQELMKDKPLNIPVMSLVCSDDEVVDPYFTYDYLFARTNPKDLHLVFSVVPLKVPATAAQVETVWGATANFGGQIVSYNHQALAVSPFNRFVGNTFRYCGYYAIDDPRREQCLTGTDVVFGTANAEALAKYPCMALLTYNPGFSKVIDALGRFLLGVDAINPLQYSSIKEMATISARSEQFRNLLIYQGWTDLKAALLTFQKTNDLGAVNSLALWAPDDWEEKLTDIDPLKSFVSVEDVDLSDNKAITDFSVLAQLREVTRLDLSGTQISDLAVLKNCKELVTLIANYTPISDVSVLASLPKLQSVELAFTKVEDFSPLASCPSLTSLTTSLDTFKGQEALGETVDLYVLIPSEPRTAEDDIFQNLLDAGGLTDLDFNQLVERLSQQQVDLTKITRCIPSGSCLQCLGIPALARLPNLRRIVITAKTPGVQAEALSALNNLSLVSLYLANVRCDTRGFSVPNITNLSLSNCLISDVAFASNLVAVNTLDVSYNSVSDLSPVSMCSSLTSINVAYTDVSNLGPLQKLKHLSSVNCEGSLISDGRSIEALRSAGVIVNSRQTPYALAAEADLNSTNIADLSSNASRAQRTFDRICQRALDNDEEVRLSVLSQRLIKSGYAAKDITRIEFREAAKDIICDSDDFINLEIFIAQPADNAHIKLSGSLENYSNLKKATIGLMGSIDSEDLGNFPPNVTRIILANVLDTVTEPLASLKNLIMLFILQNALDDKDKLTSLEGLQGLPLTRLSIYSTKVSDLSPLAGCTTLVKFDGSHTPIASISPLASCTQLTELDLNWTKVQDISSLSGLVHLQTLYLKNSEVADISVLGGLPELTELDLNWTKVEDISPLSGHTQLRKLHLRFSEVADISMLSGLSELSEIDLTWTNVQDFSPLLSCPKLAKLMVGGSSSAMSDEDEKAFTDRGVTVVRWKEED